MTEPMPEATALVPLPDGALPVRALLDELIGDQSSDYADGDHPGYFRWTWDEPSGVLTVSYEADPEADHEDTTAHFQLIEVQIP